MTANALYGLSKPPLDHDQLRDAIKLSLWAGQLLLQHGAETQRIEETVHRMGTGLGCDWMDVFVSPNALVVTATSGGEFRTKTRRVVSIGINMDVINQINALSRQIATGELSGTTIYQAVYQELRRISDLPRLYNRWLIVGVVGLACAAFSQLFGGDLAAFFITFVAAATGMFARQEMTARQFNPFVTTSITAFVAGLIASGGALLNLSTQPQVALATSVLLLVPGVPLINAAEDLIKGHLVIGMARGVNGALTSIAIAIGLLLAMTLTSIVPGEGSASGAQPSDLGAMAAGLGLDAWWSAVAAIGFAMLFNTPRHLLLACGLCGALGHAARALMVDVGVSLELATLGAATLVGFAAHLLARRALVPAPIFGITGAIPLVPGWFAYRAMIGIITFSTSAPDDMALLLAASNNVIKTAILLGALAVGIAAPALLLERSKPVV